MNAEMRVAMLLTAALLLAGCGGGSRRDYVGRNDAIVRSLPVFPGAVKMGEISRLTRPNGYRTLVLYRVPHGTRGAAVLRFYETELQRRGWQRSGRPLEEDFTRDQALVALGTLLSPAPAPGNHIGRAYDLAVDYRGASRG